MRVVSLLALLATLFVGNPRSAADAPPSLAIPHERSFLPNGLEVIIHEDHRTPLVAVSILYRTGAMHDPPGRAGLAHLTEHLTFLGTKHLGSGHLDDALHAAGMLRGNGTTSREFTTYWAVLPAAQLDTMLWLESERLGFFLEGDAAASQLETARAAVRNERGQRFDEAPGGRTLHFAEAAFFGPRHPFGQPSVGAVEDLERVTPAEVRAFFERHYRPGNAILAIAGDVQPAAARALVAKYFGPIPGERMPPPSLPPLPHLRRERRIVVEAPVPRPRLALRYPAPAAFAPGDAEFRIGAAALERALRIRLGTQGSGLVDEGHDDLFTGRLLGQYELALAPAAGRSVEAVLGAVDREIARLCGADGALDDEAVARGRAAVIAEASRAAETLDGKIGALHEAAYYGGTPAALAVRSNALARATRTSVCAAMERTLRPDRRLVVEVQPDETAPVGGRVRGALPVVPAVPPAPGPRLTRRKPTPEAPFRAAPPRNEVAPTPRSPRVERFTLGTGHEVILAEAHDAPTVSISGLWRVGTAAAPPAVGAVLVSALHGSTRAPDGTDLGDAIEGAGGRVHVHLGWDGLELGVTAVAPALTRVVPLWARWAAAPPPDDSAIEQVKKQFASQAARAANHPEARADDLLRRVLFAEGAPHAQGTISQSGALSRVAPDEVRRLHAAGWRPGPDTIVVVGNTTAAQIRPLLEEQLAAVPRRPAGAVTPSPPASPAGSSSPLAALRPVAVPVHLVDRPGADRVSVLVGLPAVAASSEDAGAAHLLGWILEGDLFPELRHRRKWIYGWETRFTGGNGHDPFTFSTSVPVEHAAATVALIRERLDAAGKVPLAGGMVAGEARELVAKLLGETETVDGARWVLVNAALRGLGDRPLERAAAQLLAASPAQLQGLAGRLFAPGRVAIVLVGDARRLAPALRAQGPLEVH